MDSGVHLDGFAGEKQADIAVQVDLPRFGTLKSESAEDKKKIIVIKHR